MTRRSETVEINAALVERERNRRLWSIGKLAEVAGLHRATLDEMPQSGMVRVHRATADKLARAFERFPPLPLVDEMLTADEP